MIDIELCIRNFEKEIVLEAFKYNKCKFIYTFRKEFEYVIFIHRHWSIR